MTPTLTDGRAASLSRDHCLDQRIAVRLRQRGFTVTTTYAEGNATLRDEDQLVFAATRGWVLVTHNKVDYQRHHRHWASQGRRHGGIIAIPQGSLARVELRIVCCSIGLASPRLLR